MVVLYRHYNGQSSRPHTAMPLANTEITRYIKFEVCIPNVTGQLQLFEVKHHTDF
jgi:hypothetical protein